MEKTIIVKAALISIFISLGVSYLFSQTTVSKDTLIEPTFSIEGGFYNGPVDVQLHTVEATIRYTTDGRWPTARSPIYDGSFRIKKTAVVRAVAMRGKKRSRVVSQTYFIDEPETSFPVVSIGVSPYILFDPRRGLFMYGGNVVDTLWQKPGANFWSRKEVSANIEIFESDGRSVYNNLTGFRLFGGMSRLFPQKSMALVARKRYGQKRFKHPIFGKKGKKSYKFLVLRNSGSDFGKTHFRDAFMTGLLEEWDMEMQAYRPAHIYINGKYWGIYNIREKVNRYFLEDHSDADKDSLDLIEHRLTRKRGSKQHYRRMLKFIEKYDLSEPANFAYLEELMDIDNFMDYQIAQIYFDNQDAGGNIKFWRPQADNGKWRWILYDTDWGFGLHDEEAYQNNSLAFHTEANGPSWPNPPWSTLILRNLLENRTFEKAFVNRFADRLNTTFNPQRVEQHINQFYQDLKPEIPRHLKRWRLREGYWEKQVNTLRTFAQERVNYVRMHLMEHANTGAMRTVEASATNGGKILINDAVEIRGNTFSGKYFEHYPIKVKAVADYGYRFVKWEGLEVDDNIRQLYIQLERKRYHIRAVFEKFTHPLVGKVMINEVSPNNKKSGDWLEIFNYSDKKVSLHEWVLTDSKNEFILPNVSLGPNDYLVICEDSLKFTQAFPQAYNIIGGMGFGLNKRQEKLGLFSRLGAVVDSVSYNLIPRDSTFTLSFLLPHLDNSDLENWEIRQGVGSPNAANPYYVESSIRIVQEQWMQIGVAAGIVLLCIMLLILRKKGLL